MIAGVCGGLGRYFDTDPMWFRLGFVVVTLAGGAGILIYLISWLIIPVILGLAVVIGSLGRANRQT